MLWWQSGNLHRISISAPVWMHPVAIWAGLMIINNLPRLGRELGSWIAGFYVVLQVSIQFIRISRWWGEWKVEQLLTSSSESSSNAEFCLLWVEWNTYMSYFLPSYSTEIPRDYCKYRESLSEKNISFAFINTSSSDPGINAFCSNQEYIFSI